ncbi:MAG: pyridoxal-phosphate dependent enzyme, partial [Gammaproteobacteria bacterium]|nr:pyridoxal-phosphate dependent enzyme [Gammaproteobacteria bacterium]
DDTARSLANGKRAGNEPSARSICDALLADMPGRIPFEILRELASGGLVVSDDDVRQAMRFAFQKLKIVVEPGGAAALAAVLAGKIDTAGKTTAIIFSGGNVDTELFASIQREPA